MRVLVVGGAGYVGSHACLALAQAGHTVTVFDDLSTGHARAVQWGELIRGSLLQPPEIDAAMSRVAPDVVMHFAARSLVGESMRDPYAYYQGNVAGTLNLLEAMRRHGVHRLVFSSTAAIFGEPVSPLIDEGHPKVPLNPYGRSKLMIEWILEDAARSYGLRAIALRYFNAAGADPQGRIGEAHEPETHLIPRLLRRAAGENLQVGIFGGRHPTRDGTCVRDYVHVLDLAAAHLAAAALTGTSNGFQAFNLGTGTGYSVREMVDAVERLIGRPLRLLTHAARQGDPATLVAANDRAHMMLGWTPRHSALEQILRDAWRWHRPRVGPLSSPTRSESRTVHDGPSIAARHLRSGRALDPGRRSAGPVSDRAAMSSARVSKSRSKKRSASMPRSKQAAGNTGRSGNNGAAEPDQQAFEHHASEHRFDVDRDRALENARPAPDVR